MNDFVNRASRSLTRRLIHANLRRHIYRLNDEIQRHANIPQNGTLKSSRPVVFFNASTRLDGLSLNAAYSLITRWAVQLSGVPVVNFVCKGGMSHCVLGTNRDHPQDPPPCAACIRQSEAVYANSITRDFQFAADPKLAAALQGLTIEDLTCFEYEGIPLGALVLPSARWILRRHHLLDNDETRYLYSQYILSAYRVGQEFARLLEETQPRAVVVFNGMFYPEATARWFAWNRAPGGVPLRVISHEVALRPFTAFFTTGDATAYPIQIDDSFQLDDRQNQVLDAYLQKRLQGNFTMAGVRFWPEMRRLDDDFLNHAAQFRQIVPVFTNVIFDTSQPHSNVVFPHMFAWLDQVVDLARAHPDTLFVIRAHPDEARPGKESLESVAGWVAKNRVTDLPNLMFVEPRQYFSSYELIQRSKFVMVYNSTIGLEASIMGAPVLCGGRARFTQLPTVYFPETPEAHRQQAETFLTAETISPPEIFRVNARRFLYYQLYQTSLPFGDFIREDGVWQGYVKLKPHLRYTDFDPQNSPVLKIIVEGILNGEEFLLNE